MEVKFQLFFHFFFAPVKIWNKKAANLPPYPRLKNQLQDVRGCQNTDAVPENEWKREDGLPLTLLVRHQASCDGFYSIY